MQHSDFILRDLLAHDAWIRGLARCLVNDGTDAEDLVQDLWVASLESPPAKIRSLRAWLRGAIRNLAAVRARSERRRIEREVTAARSDEVASVEEIREREDARLRLVHAVFALQEPYRSAVLQRYFNELPVHEIARQTGASVAAVEKRITRGIQKLRHRLDGEFGDRAAWCAALIPLMGLSPTGPATAGGAAAGAVMGATVMGIKAKVGVAFALAALGLLGVWAFLPPPSERRGSLESESQRGSAPPRDATPPGHVAAAGDVAGRALSAAADRVDGAPAASDAEVPGTGAVSGRIRFEGAEAAPIEAARVLVLHEPSGKWKQARSDRQGVYRLAGLLPAPWKIRVEPPGYPRLADALLRIGAGKTTTRDFEVPRGTLLTGRVVDDITGKGVAGARIAFLRPFRHEVVADDRGAYRAAGVTGTMFLNVEVKAEGYNRRLENHHFGHSPPATATLEIRLRPMARVSGVVLDSHGVAVAGARVRHRFDQLLGSESDGPTTDAHGRFSVTLPTTWLGRQSPASLFAYREGYAYGFRDDHYHTDGEQVEDVVIRLRAAGTIAGRVTAAASFENAIVHCWTTNEAARRRGRDCFQAAVESQGGYLLRDLPPGAYQVQVRAEHAVSSICNVAVVAGETRSLQLELARKSGVIRGIVVDEAGGPVAAARITISRHPHPYGTPKPPAVLLVTDGDGRFRAEGLEDLTYHVFAAKRGYSSNAKADVPPGHAELRIVLDRRQGTVLKGTVVDEAGAPLARSRIGVLEDQGGKLKVIRNRSNTIARDLKDGAFEVQVPFEARERRLLLEAVTEDGRCSARHVVMVGPGLPVKPVRLTVRRGAVIRGSVLDPNGEAVSRAFVFLESAAAGIHTFLQTSVTGGFLSPGLPECEMRIRVAHRDWDGHEQTVAVRNGQAAELKIVLEPHSAEVSLLVLTAEGRPVAGAQVLHPHWPTPQAGRREFEAAKQGDPHLRWHDYRRRFTTTDENGLWSRRNVRSGQGSISIRAEGFEDKVLQVTLRKGERRSLRVVLRPKS